MIPARIFMSWHRRLSIFAALALLAWALSGIAHPIMTRLQPTPLHKAPPPIMQMGQRDVSAVLPQFIGASDLRIVAINDALYFRRERNNEVHYLALEQSGPINDHLERDHAIYLARYYSGENTTPIASVEKLDQFRDDYPFVNRLLPVWAVRFARDDGLTAYVDTKTERLSLLSDDTKAAFSTFFRIAHNFRFLENWPTLRISIMLLLISSSVLAAIMGLTLWWRLRANAKQRLQYKPLRRWHRHLALPLSFVFFSFALSAGWHCWHNYQTSQQSEKVAHTDRIVPSEKLVLPQHNSNQMQLISLQGKLWWRTPVMKNSTAPSGEHHHEHDALSDQLLAVWSDASTGELNADIEPRFRTQLVAQFTPQAITQFSAVTEFGGEYGFVNKRLPVYRALLSNGERLYIDPNSGAQAAYFNDADALEGLTFHYLHKWNWVPGGKNWRDGISVLAALMIAILAVMGLVMYWQRQKR